MFQRYPMSLYRGGDVSSDHVIVKSEDEEAAQRAEGFRGAWEPQEKGALTAEQKNAIAHMAQRESNEALREVAGELLKARRGRTRKVTE